MFTQCLLLLRCYDVAFPSINGLGVIPTRRGKHQYMQTLYKIKMNLYIRNVIQTVVLTEVSNDSVEDKKIDELRTRILKKIMLYTLLKSGLTGV